LKILVFVHPYDEVNILISFIKNYDLNNIKSKFMLLYTLNVLDIISTVLLLTTGLFMEGNYFMTGIVSNPWLCGVIKFLMPGILLFWVFIRMKSATQGQLRKSNIFINTALGLYLLINLSHLFWIIFVALIYN
jgi:uncharacterized membrane protein SirB2